MEKETIEITDDDFKRLLTGQEVDKGSAVIKLKALDLDSIAEMINCIF